MRTDIAKEEVIICGSVMIGRDIIVVEVENMSYRFDQLVLTGTRYSTLFSSVPSLKD